VRRIALWLGAVLLTACLLEGGARLALLWLGEGPPIEVGWEQGAGRAAQVRDLVYVPDEEMFFRLAPGLDVEETGNPRIFDLKTNSRGLRGNEVALPKPEGVHRVLAVGDSCTFGSGAGQDETWGVEVINAGVPGFSSYQALRYLEVEGFGLEPDLVIFTSGVNDASPATAGGKRRFGSGLRLSDREYADALKANRRLGITRLLWRAGVGGGGAKRRVPLEDYVSNLEGFVAQSLSRGITPVIVAWPLRAGADPEVEQVLGQYHRAARIDGAVFVDLAEGLKGRDELFIDAVHLSPEGYGVVAREIFKQIQLDRSLSDFMKKTSSPGAGRRPHPLYKQQHPLPKRSGLHSWRSAARFRFPT
jgi:lysophospholipase L1-like esterase